MSPGSSLHTGGRSVGIGLAVGAAALTIATVAFWLQAVFTDPTAPTISSTLVALLSSAGSTAAVVLGVMLIPIARAQARPGAVHMGLALVLSGSINVVATVLTISDVSAIDPALPNAASALGVAALALPGTAAVVNGPYRDPRASRVALVTSALLLGMLPYASGEVSLSPHPVAVLAVVLALCGAVSWAWHLPQRMLWVNVWVVVALALNAVGAAAALWGAQPGTFGYVVSSAASFALTVPAAACAVLLGRAHVSLARSVDTLSREAQSLQRATDTIVHDLNQPTAAARSALSVARVQATPGVDAALKIVERAQDDLAVRLESLNNYRRLGTQDPAFSPVDLGVLVRDIAARYGPEKVTVAGSASVLGDAEMLQRLVINLLANAKQHGAGACAVTLTTRVDRMVSLRVDDDGPGVPEHLRAVLFEPFRRGPQPSAGTGLGLSIISMTAKQHGGDVALVDGELGGACFEVLLDPGSYHPSLG